MQIMYRKAARLTKVLSVAVVGITTIAAIGANAQASNIANLPSVSAAPGQPAPILSSPNAHLNGMQKATPNATNSPVYYYNWSGYADTASTPFNAVRSTFVQPTVTCPVPGAWTLFWVGFDGFNNGTVEQAGTAAQCTTDSNPHPIYYAWWEMWPTNLIQVMPISINPGDTISASAIYTASNASYSLNVTDKSNKQQYTQVTTCAANLSCVRQSAEWIVERPTLNDGSYSPLANWNTMQLKTDQAATTTAVPRGNKPGKPIYKPISAFSNTPIYMQSQNSGATMAAPGSLNKAGNLFSDNWLAAQ